MELVQSLPSSASEKHSCGKQETYPARGMLTAMARRQAKMGIAPSQAEPQSGPVLEEETLMGLKEPNVSAWQEQLPRKSKLGEREPELAEEGEAESKETEGERKAVPGEGPPASREGVESAQEASEEAEQG